MNEAVIGSRRFERATAAALIAACLCYALQCFTPLRLEEDVVVYLTTAHTALEGHGFEFGDQPSPFPPGYPFIVALMKRLGLGTSVFLNFLNLAAAALGIAAVARIQRLRGAGPGTLFGPISLCVFSFGMIKGTGMEMSDVCCFGVTLWAVALAEAAVRKDAPGRATWLLWAGAVSLAATAWATRMAGAAIVGAVLIEGGRAGLRARGRSRSVALAVAAVAGVGVLTAIAALYFERHSPGVGRYLKNMAEYAQRSPAAVVGDHLTELGEMLLNVPKSKAPTAALPFFVAAGLGVVAVMGVLLIGQRSRWRPGHTFLVLFAAMVFVYPRYCELRVWLPAIPLFAMEIAGAVRALPSGAWMSRAAAVYALYFILTGFGALGYSLWLTVSPHAFINAPISRNYRGEYSAWFGLQPVNADLNPQVLTILREFGGPRGHTLIGGAL